MTALSSIKTIWAEEPSKTRDARRRGASISEGFALQDKKTVYQSSKIVKNTSDKLQGVHPVFPGYGFVPDIYGEIVIL